MATHSSILAWRIPWTEELGGLQSMGRKESDTTEQLHFHFHFLCRIAKGFPGGAEVKASACNVGDLGLIPGLGRPPGEEKGHPLQYSGLENPMDRGAWWATVHGSQRVGHN